MQLHAVSNQINMARQTPHLMAGINCNYKPLRWFKKLPGHEPQLADIRPIRWRTFYEFELSYNAISILEFADGGYPVTKTKWFSFSSKWSSEKSDH